MAAEFTINDTAFDTLEYDATYDEVLTLQLEDTPAFDASIVKYSVVVASHEAPALTFSPSSGVPATPGGAVTVTMPSSGCHTYILQCEINGGRDSTGRTNPAYTKQRGVCIRSANLELRKWVPGETTQFHASGWTVEQNVAVDALDAAGGGGGGGGVPTTRDVFAGAGLTGGGSLASDITLNVAAHADGSITVNANDIQVGVLATDTQHGVRGRGNLHQTANVTDDGFMSAAHYTAVQGATATPTAGQIAKYGSGNSLTADRLLVGEQGAFASVGDISGDEDFSIYAVKADTNDVRVLEVNTSTLIIGDENNALTPEIRSAANTGVAFRHGASLTTYFKPLPSGNCSAPGHIRLDASTGLAYVWSAAAGAEVQLAVGSAAWDVVFGAASAQYAGSPRYLQPGVASSTSALAGAATARACTASSISVCCAGLGTGTGSYVFTLFKINASTGATTTTGLAVTIAATARAAIATGSVSLTAGELYGVQYVVTGSVSTSMTNVTVTIGFTA